MATNSKKGRSTRDSDKKSSRRTDATSSAEETRDETPQLTEDLLSPTEDQSLFEEPQPKDPTPEPIYEEPVLTQLIVEEYNGEKVRGLYEGEGEAWFAGGHHYKGQFSEGLMHGHGVYTWSDGVTYEGEFMMNKVTGKGTYTWIDGSTYDGDVLNGLRHGYGTFSSPENMMGYVGEWSLGKRHGKGRMYYDSEGLSFYEGDWVNNVSHGWGTRRYKSGNLYQGMWFNNVRHGDGTMRWLDRDQMYTGQWEDGIQHGMGQHIWFVRRVPGSQYPLRNTYDGEFVHGLREGYGIYYYANGARYEGEWKDNMKCGKGKFVFKNGRVYEGMFDKDHIVEFPNFEMDGLVTPDMSQIRTRTPLPSEQMSVHSNESRNTYSPSFQLDVDHLLEEFAESEREEEAAQVIFVIMRHVTSLRKIYAYYSNLGYEESPDNTYIMNKMQFWRFIKDCQLHHKDMTLMEMDRVLAPNKSQHLEMHNPYAKVLFREFTNNLVTLAYHLYRDEHQGSSPLLAWCLSKMIAENILKFACSVKGYIYYETRRAVNAMIHLEQAYDVYKAFCVIRKLLPNEPSMKMRQFLYMLQDLKLINSDLTPNAIINILASDDPKVKDEEEAINLELEITFLEFFEALVGCAEVYVTESVVKDPSTPRPSTIYTNDQSDSVPGSASRGASQSALDDDGTDGVSGQDHDTETGSAAPLSASQMTYKTGDGSSKPDHQMSHATASVAETHDASHHTHMGSARKSETSMLGDQKKGSSCLSGRSGTSDSQHPLMQSVISMGGARSEIDDELNLQGEEEEDDGDHEEIPTEELDEATRQFNFWTHQLHIFFVRKFFPVAQHRIFLNQLVKEKYAGQVC